MIKLNAQGTAPDYTEHGSVSTDCKTVGKFMTQVAAIFVGNLTVIVDGCRYEFSDNPKIRITDDTPIDEISYASVPGRISFKVKTKPKPKTVKKSGWVCIYRATDDVTKWIDGTIYDTKEEADKLPISESRIAVAKIEWEEVAE